MIISILLVILLLLIFISLSKNPKLKNSKQKTLIPTNSLTKLNPKTFGSPVIIKGWLKCLTRKISNVTCIIGLEDISGQDYGLVNKEGEQLNQTNLISGARYNATGNYIATPDFLQNYKIQGTIKLKR